MLEKSDTDVAAVLAAFNSKRLDVGLLVPTITGMQKSIMDATSSLRDYLSDNNFHEYQKQAQGPEAKRVKQASFVWPDRLEPTTVSMYRPNTKSGDPRIWFGKLKSYAKPHNLLAVLVHNEELYIINCSNSEVMASLASQLSPLGKIVSSQPSVSDPKVNELLEKLKAISSLGFVPTQRVGDTGVGMTLETLLGISANSSKSPDFHGIELKAKRNKKGSQNRTTLFSQVPNWKLSPIGNAWNLLSTYGYFRDGKLRLNHEISATTVNSIGFYLAVDRGQDWLTQNHKDFETEKSTHVVTWQLQDLRNRLLEKHPQTFWVAANSRGKGEHESFHYVSVEHTSKPNVRNFDALIESGIISVDYLMSQKGEQRVRDHGYLFKMHASNFSALFPPSNVYDLT